jgi:hypothetical protein
MERVNFTVRPLCPRFRGDERTEGSRLNSSEFCSGLTDQLHPLVLGEHRDAEFLCFREL